MSLLERMPPILLPTSDDPHVLESFLAAIEPEIAEIKQEADYLGKASTLSTADVSQPFRVYRGFIPAALRDASFDVRSSLKTSYTRAHTIREFLRVSIPQMKFEELHVPRIYYLDIDSKRIYIHHPEPFLTVDLYKNEVKFDSLEIELEEHPLWNDFDELGLYYALPRLHQEDNLTYKKRLLEVRALLGGNTELGLLFAMHRKLGWVYEKTWEDPETPITLLHRLIVKESIRVDGRVVPLETQESDGYTTIQPIDQEDAVRLRYYAGIRFGQTEDIGLADVPKIHQQAPVLWGDKPWGFGFWPEDHDHEGMDVVPTKGDVW